MFNQEPIGARHNQGGSYDVRRVIPASQKQVSSLALLVPFFLPSNLCGLCVKRFSSSCSLFTIIAALAGSVLLPGRVLAAEVPASAAPTFDHMSLLAVVVGLGMLVTMINGALGIWDKLKPKPPLHQQFSSIDHRHAGVVTESECTHRHDEFVRDQRHLVKHATLDREAIQRQLDGVRQEIKDNDRKAEERASDTHTRINGISAPLNSLIGRFEDHLRFSKSGKGDTLS